ncbi:mRNA cleavage and polyadenylation factor I/II complex, subunit Pcf11 [Phaffia rhodozyma]|uniref:mRNA cleavage and polyadenylation factor I/II complex, subunit Pcf11 n=1 Tax=Phaffia rhodozyma TaxID=264483 RepID=A0A0F7SWY4_PHARH|nr:mRNA cleavage and polyadenylation factor I/II complex, subunit Pcf11 [Phaffia rhodozyma]
MSFHYGGQPASYPSTSYAAPAPSSSSIQSTYQQPSYPSAGQPYYGAYQAPPPPPPMSAQEAFRVFYRSHLAILTVNSRPIINQLTQLAYEQQANFANAMVIAEELVKRINEAPPHQKLPPFFLLDSVSKNFPTPYATLFLRYLSSLFASTYASVDGSTKSRMEEMLRTWRTGGPGGSAVFGIEVQEEIEMRIWGRDYVTRMHQQTTYQTQYSYPPQAPSAQMTPTYGSPPVLTRQALLATLQQVLTRRYRAAALSPMDENIRRHIDILKQLQQLVETSNVSETDLRAIETQLQEIDASTSAPPPVVPSPSVAVPTPIPSQIPIGMPPPTLASSPPYPTPSHSTPFTLPPSSAPVPSLSVPAVSPQVFQPTARSPLPPSGNAPRTGTPSSLGADLLSLMASVLKPREASNSPQVPKKEIVSEVPSVEEVEQQKEENEDKESEPDEYEKMILGLNVRLDNLNLKADLPRISSLLSAQLPLQCRQCGLRAPATAKGKAKLDLHLDWHFRQNKRTRESEGRGNSRAWFVDAKDWVNDFSPSPDSIPPTGSHPTKSAQEASSQGGLSASARQALLKKFVVQPSNPEVASRPCPICKEAFKGEFSEDEEEWLWFNAVEEDGVIFHATCRHDSIHPNALTTRLLSTANGNLGSSNRLSSLTPPPMSPIADRVVKQEKAEPTSEAPIEPATSLSNVAKLLAQGLSSVKTEPQGNDVFSVPSTESVAKLEAKPPVSIQGTQLLSEPIPISHQSVESLPEASPIQTPELVALNADSGILGKRKLEGNALETSIGQAIQDDGSKSDSNGVEEGSLKKPRLEEEIEKPSVVMSGQT